MYAGLANLMFSIFRVVSTDALATLIIVLTLICWVATKKFWTFPEIILSYLALAAFFWIADKIIPDSLEFIGLILVICLCIWAWQKY